MPDPVLTIEQYFDIVSEARRDNPSWRDGQIFFNVLAAFRPDLSEQIRGTELDPFYDHNISAFFVWLVENW